MARRARDQIVAAEAELRTVGDVPTADHFAGQLPPA